MAIDLLLIIKILIFLLLLVWGTISFSLIFRKIRSRQLKKIETTFATQVGLFLYPPGGEEYSFLKVKNALQEVGAKPSKKANIQFLIDLMIRTQKSMLGDNYLKIRVLFGQIPPFRASFSKLRSRKWYIKARGIREIYEMEQEQYLEDILKEINHPNIYVRREAQIAVVVFLGWKSLKYLPYLEREVTLWQQIKVVEKLFELHPDPKLKFLKRAYNTEKPYAQELLMRIIRKFHLFTEVHYILAFLNHENFDRRETAIYCINSFGLTQDQLDLVKQKFFQIDNVEQQVQLLKYIERVSEVTDLDFYKQVLQINNDILKLSAAEILWNSNNEDVVQEFYYKQYSKPTDLKAVV